jgi:type III secretory pathway component EscU
MGFNKVFELIKSNWKIILFIGIIVYLVSQGCIEDNYIEKNGIAVTVVVKFYDRLLFNIIIFLFFFYALILKAIKKRRYYPDFYIPKENLIIEVKSQWTLELHKDKNQAKFQAVKEAGFNFRLEIR